MNIVHINTSDFGGGAANVAFRLAETQRRDGHNARILSGFKNASVDFSRVFDPIADRTAFVECVKHGLLYYELQGSHCLLTSPEIQDADIIHLHNLHGNYFNPFSIILLSRIKPVIWTLHDMQSLTGHCAHSFECNNWINGCHDCPHLDTYPALPIDSTSRLWYDKKTIYDYSLLSIVTPSQWLEAKVRKGILSKHPVTTIYNGVNTKVFKSATKSEVRKKFGLPESALIIGSVAFFGVLSNPFKGGTFTLSILNEVFRTYPNAYFLNIGGEYETQNSRIINTGYIKDEVLLSELYSALDVFLYLTRADNCPLVILEALACGVPTIASSIGGIPELIKHAVNGFIIDEGDTASTMHYIEQLATDQNLSDSIKNNATISIKMNFDHNLINKYYYNEYHRTITDWTERSKPAVNLYNIPQIIRNKLFLESLMYCDKLNLQPTPRVNQIKYQNATHR